MLKVVLVFGFLTSGMSFAASAEKVLLDVRTEEEWKEKKLTDSVIDFKKADFKDQVSKLDKTKHYQLFCRSGNRSGQAVKIMKDLGFKNVESIGSLEDAAKITGKKCEGPACG